MATTVETDRAFLGHPRGLAYLAFTEAWERFSYYGMTALVVLYMVEQLFQPGHIEHVAGMAAYRGALESVFGPLSVQGLASMTYGYYAGLVYFTPMIGGLVADRLLGTRRTVLLGALLMSAGHFAMAFDASFLLALLLLILGSGFLKGNISAQIGHLYPPHEISRRTQAFTIFSMAINFGAVIGPLACGLLAQLYGWHAGFGAAGVLMLLATVTYLAGQRHLPEQRPRAKDREPSAPLTRDEWRKVLLLLVVIALTIFQMISYNQQFNVGMVWVSDHAELATPLGAIPTPWFNSIDALFSIIGVPPLVWLWARQAAKGREPGDLAKIGIGAAIMCVASGLMVLAAWLAGDGKASALIPFAAFALSGIAFLYCWPPMLALVSCAAPAKVNATMMGIAFLALFAANVLLGWIGSFYETMGAVPFWTLNSAITAAGAVLAFALGPMLTRGLDVP